jgi:hypothetical protein
MDNWDDDMDDDYQESEGGAIKKLVEEIVLKMVSCVGRTSAGCKGPHSVLLV